MDCVRPKVNDTIYKSISRLYAVHGGPVVAALEAGLCRSSSTGGCNLDMDEICCAAALRNEPKAVC